MSEMRRIRSKVAGFFGRGLTTTEVGDDGTTERANGSDDGDASVDERPQFTVTKARKNVTLADRIRDSVSHRDVDEHTYDPNSLFAKYIHWTFRASFADAPSTKCTIASHEPGALGAPGTVVAGRDVYNRTAT